MSVCNWDWSKALACEVILQCKGCQSCSWTFTILERLDPPCSKTSVWKVLKILITWFRCVHSFYCLHTFSKLCLFFQSKNCTDKMQNASHLLQNEALDSKYHKHILKANICRHLCHYTFAVVFCKKCFMKLKTESKANN